MENKLNEKSYQKSKTVRKLLREEMFERNRKLSNKETYLTHYDPQTQLQIGYSLTNPLPIHFP
jgi:exonuclease VII large subunit